MLETH